MAWLRALSCACFLSGALAAGRALDLSDSVSVVQGRVHAHQHAAGEAPVEAGTCLAAIGEEVEERLEPALASKAQLVVVRAASEDVRWLDAIPEIPAVLYSHSGLAEQLPQPRANLHVETQPNTGVQAESLLRHIVNNYDNLPDLTVFLNGWPFWACAGTFELVRRGLRNGHDLVDSDMVNNGALPGLVPLAGSFDQFSLKQGLLGHWRFMNVAERDLHNMNPQEAMDAAARSYNATCQEMLGRPCPDRHWVAEGGQWVVSRERIHSQPKAFYQRLLELNVPGPKLHMTRLKGVLLEAFLPVIWGAENWSPGDAARKAKDGKMAGSLRRVDAVGNYCIFSTDRANMPAPSERRGVCELERHQTGSPGASISLTEEGRFTQGVALRAVHDHTITRQMVKDGSKSEQAEVNKPKREIMCGRRHTWEIASSTRIQNKETGKCIERNGEKFVMIQCKDKMVDVQQLHFITKDNQGYFQILDKAEGICLAHNSPGGTKCTMGTDGGAAHEQQWDIVRQGSGSYIIKMREGSDCLIPNADRLRTGDCTAAGALWDLRDVAGMGQYYKRFDYALTQSLDGKVKMRCAMQLHSSNDEAHIDSVQPEWRKRGKLLNFELVDAKDGSYYFSQRMASGKEWYLNCDHTSHEVTFGDLKTGWKIRPVSDGLVFLESKKRVLQFISDGGHVRCSPLPEDGVPLKDTTFAMEFLQRPAREL
mmetsp:Transcript_63912/g.186904  ORF Transcript_63912/g.186904 Transcript_63912/m.186904 type:complete len:707 (+) Transcript_63912:65-2185(+)